LVNPEYKATQAEDEISSKDIIQFFSRNAKFIGLVTVGLSVIAITLPLLSPKQYQKQLTLSVKFPSVSLSVGSFPELNINYATALAVEFLRTSKLDQITIKAQSNPETQEIDVHLQSPNANYLSSSSPRLISQLKTRFQEPVSQSLETSLSAIEQQLEKQKRILPQLEQTIAQLPATNTPKLQALEIQRAERVAAIAALEVDKDYLEQSQKNLTGVTTKVMSVKILSESEVEPISSTKQLVIIAVITSFMAAVIAAILRDQVGRLKDELSKQKIDRNTDF
jgi:Asp-tRNA(Asn)/Glu-tRNA(Gln) amidotransferase C subunit